MKANEKQVGGLHYKTEYEHWDLVICIPMNYLEGCATKYVARARKKDGVQDLHKAMHYLEKLIEIADHNHQTRNLTRPEIHAEVNRFALANNLTLLEEEFVVVLCTHEHGVDLHHARCLLEEIITEAEIEAKKNMEINFPGTTEDGGHHAI